MTTQMRSEVAEDPVRLMQTINTSQDFATLIWAAGALNACLLKQAPLASYEDAFEEFQIPNGRRYLPKQWISQRMDYKAPPRDAAEIIARRIEGLEMSGQTNKNQEAMEASAWLLASLLELVRDTRRADGLAVRKLLLDGRYGLAARPAQPASAVGAAALAKNPRDGANERMGFGPALISTMTARLTDTDDITTNRDVAFINGCLLLAHIAEGDEQVATGLQRAGVPELVCARIFHKASLTPAELWRRKLPLRWEGFATCSSQLLQVILEAHPVTSNVGVQTDAFLCLLDRSFNSPAGMPNLPFASTVLNMVHLSTFKALDQIVRSVPSEAARMIAKKALMFAAQLLKVPGIHEEAVRLIFGYIMVLLIASRNRLEDAAAAGLNDAVNRAMNPYERYVDGTAQLQQQLARLRELIGAPVSPTNSVRSCQSTPRNGSCWRSPLGSFELLHSSKVRSQRKQKLAPIVSPVKEPETPQKRFLTDALPTATPASSSNAHETPVARGKRDYEFDWAKQGMVPFDSPPTESQASKHEIQ